MNDKKLDQIIAELSAIKKLLIVLLQNQDVKVGNIAKALGVTSGRVSQMVPTRENKKNKEGANG